MSERWDDVEALARVLATSTWDKHRTPATRPCGHCLAAREQAERILADPDPLLAALAEAGILTRVTDALRDAADEIDAELVCCDIYAEREGKGIPHGHRHQICYWASAAAGINRHRADELEKEQEGGQDG